MHIHHAYQSCISIIHIHHEYASCISIIHSHHPYPSCISIIHIHQAYASCISIMHIHHQHGHKKLHKWKQSDVWILKDEMSEFVLRFLFEKMRCLGCHKSSENHHKKQKSSRNNCKTWKIVSRLASQMKWTSFRQKRNTNTIH